MMGISRTEQSAIEAAAKECFVNTSRVAISAFISALQKRNVDTSKNLSRLVYSTDYLDLRMNDV
ncbi:hypothetical protein CPB97_005499, partial [Podila verticillata]